MSDALYSDLWFRPFYVPHDLSREAGATAIDPSLPSSRLLWVFEHRTADRRLRDALRANDDPEFRGKAFGAVADIPNLYC